jgi:hypothetical protein
LPGKRSPNGSKSIEVEEGRLMLRKLGTPAQILASDLHVPTLGTTHGEVPILWLDEDRILTQDGNGNLIAISTDGMRIPVATIPIEREPHSSPRLHRDPDGRITYRCGSEEYAVDVDAGTWEKCEWVKLGYDFDAYWSENWQHKYGVRHEGKEIGWFASDPHRLGRMATTEGSIALISEEPDGPSLQIWSHRTGSWLALVEKASSLIGWIELD